MLAMICGLQTHLTAILMTIVWGVVERVTNKTACNNKAELRGRICQVFQDLSPEIVKRACSRFVIDAEGGFIE